MSYCQRVVVNGTPSCPGAAGTEKIEVNARLGIMPDSKPLVTPTIMLINDALWKKYPVSGSAEGGDGHKEEDTAE